MTTKFPIKPRRSATTKQKHDKSPAAYSKAKKASAALRPPNLILVPLDFSVHSSGALEYARAFARQFRARIVLIHVVEAFPIDYMLGFHSARAANARLIEHSRARLQQVAKEFFGVGGAAPESVVTFGRPFQEIARAAKEQRADLIILATHGYTGFKHIQLGSTAERVVRHAPCPVLVVRAAESSAGAGKPEPAALRRTKPAVAPARFKVQRILVPLDFSPRSGRGLEYAVLMGRRFDANVVLLHVIHAEYLFANSDYSGLDYPELIEELRIAGKKQLGETARSLFKTKPVGTILKSGHPGNSIVETADELGIDLIIMTTHGRAGFKRALLGSTAEFVVRHAHCPVLIVRK